MRESKKSLLGRHDPGGPGLFREKGCMKIRI